MAALSNVASLVLMHLVLKRDWNDTVVKVAEHDWQGSWVQNPAVNKKMSNINLGPPNLLTGGQF